MNENLFLVGRDAELMQILSCLKAERNVLLEGPVGVGKTHLALAIAKEIGSPVYRIDGDSRYSEQKLSGWFDPPMTIKKGFGPEAFIPGPLVEAMQKGGILFINELNRLPEGVQNVLLPAMDERMIIIPRLGEIRASKGFLVIATQNPKEFVATSHLSEAILDRFELIRLDYQTEDEEIAIVRNRLEKSGNKDQSVSSLLTVASVRLVRITRGHPRVRRGASIRAALSIAEISSALLERGMKLRDAVLNATVMALPTRIELESEGTQENGETGSPHSEIKNLFMEWVDQVLSPGGQNSGTEALNSEKLKKKT